MTARSRILFVFLSLALVFTAACSAFRKDETKTYPISGRVVALDPASKQVVVAHDAIPGLMDAMTMGFPLKDERDFTRVQPNDRIEGTLHVSKTQSLLEIVVIQRGPEGEAAADAPRAPEPGETVPDVAMINHAGKRLRLAGYRGRTVILTFIYTRCPLPDFCPRMNMHFARIAEALAAQPGARDRFQLLTISFDPAFDTPKVMAEHRALYRLKESPSDVPWDFATSTPEDVARLAEFFGLKYEGEGVEILHTLRTSVLDPQGKVVRVFNGNAWEPKDVLDVLAGK